VHDVTAMAAAAISAPEAGLTEFSMRGLRRSQAAGFFTGVDRSLGAEPMR